MRCSWSLQTRFLLATSALVAVLCVAFGFAIHQFIELLEDEMLNRTLVRQMEQFKLDLSTHPQLAPPAAGGLSGYVVRSSADAAALPREVRALANGVHEDVLLRGRIYFVAVDAVGQTRLYLLLDTERVDALERNVIAVACLVGLLALGIAAALGVALSRAVMRPVTALASDVARLDPARRNERLENHFADREVGLIAAAFDDYMERLDLVLEREQAFTEDASHELRTPLSIVLSAAELLSEERALSPAGRERVERIRRASGQMESLIEALLFLARGEEGVRPQACALDQIVQEAVAGIAASAAAKALALKIQIEPVVVIGTPAMIACVVNNLLLNAVNFTQNGAIEVILTAASLVVSDTGIGIPPQDLSHIFERRYRGAHSRGLGLGLYLVSRICERLGWTIATQSSEGRGTTFSIRLPSPVVPRDAVTGNS